MPLNSQYWKFVDHQNCRDFYLGLRIAELSWFLHTHKSNSHICKQNFSTSRWGGKREGEEFCKDIYLYIYIYQLSNLIRVKYLNVLQKSCPSVFPSHVTSCSAEILFADVTVGFAQFKLHCSYFGIK